jgi:acetyl esterase/lipase
MILPHTFLKLCLKAYLRDERLKADVDPLISPILTSMEVLARYPKTEIFVGNKDPFHDDCCRLVERMK